MNRRQRLHEIELMISQLDKHMLVDYIERSSSPVRWSVYLLNGEHHIGDSATTHSYLSGAVAVKNIIVYGERTLT